MNANNFFQKILAALTFALALSSSAAFAAGAKSPVRVALITMNKTDPYWSSVMKGAERAASELGGVDLVWLAPGPGRQSPEQARIVEDVARSGSADAILFAASEPDAPAGALRKAAGAGIRIIYVDSPANFPADGIFMTDNHAAGLKAGETLRTILERSGTISGKIGVIGDEADAASTSERERGFLSAFDKSGFEILDAKYCRGDPSSARSLAGELIVRGVVGLFGETEEASKGVALAREDFLGDDLKCIGFGQPDALDALLDSGALNAAIAQDPDAMGYWGTRKAVSLLRGAPEYAPKYTGVRILTKNEM
jgi:ribose transport system substrate-binding protein